MASDIIESVFGPLYGHPCWEAKSGYGSFMTMEFGEPYLEVREPLPPEEIVAKQLTKTHSKRRVWVRGDWHLWIYCCEWQVTTDGEIKGHSDLQGSSKEHIKRGAYELDGQKLVRVAVNPENGTSCFEFDLGSRLETKPYNEDSEQWELFEPSGKVFVYRADGKYSHQPGNTLPKKIRWHSF